MYTDHIVEGEVRYLQVALLAWYDKHGRALPWRASGLDEYALVIAEVLLQRTNAERVSTFYNDFITSFPDWHALHQTDVQIVAEYLRPLGLFTQRAKRLKSLAKEMVDRGGILPRQRTELESIPLFGQYIANAIEMIIFNNPLPLIDVNMARVLERYFGPRKLVDIRYDPYLQELAHRIVSHPKAKEINWAILDFGALVCKAHQPLCLNCILNDTCAFIQNALQNKNSANKPA